MHHQTIYLLRHTTLAIEQGICYGQSDIDVSELFTSEVPLIKDKVKHLSFDKIYSSPLQRCSKLAYTLGETVHFDDRLKELNFGKWEGVEWDRISKTEAGKQWFSDYINTPCLEGESFMDMFSRVSLFIEEKKDNGEKMLIVTHDGVIRSILSALGSIDRSNIFSIKIPHGQLVEIKNNKYKML